MKKTRLVAEISHFLRDTKLVDGEKTEKCFAKSKLL
jgi:hypothetical protein